MNAPNAPVAGDEALDEALTPTIAIPPKPWVMPTAIGGAVALGLFVSMNVSQHGARAQALTAPAGQASGDQADAPPPPQFGSPVSRPAPPPSDPPKVFSAASPPPPPPPAVMDIGDVSSARLKAPSLVVDLSAASDDEGAASNASRAMAADKDPTPGGKLASADKAGGDRESVNERFAKTIGEEQVDTVRATALRAPGTTILQGTVIPAVLETALNTDLPGYLRAIVSQDVKSFDGSVVLIPRASRLLGQYRSAVARGQSRAFVVWSRLIRPDGASIMLSSPGGDALGRAGLTGGVDNHFARQFGSAILLSVISAGSQALANDHNAQLIIGGTGTATPDPLPSSFLSKEADIPPTVKVPQGAPMTVFVAKDLDFTDVTPGHDFSGMTPQATSAGVYLRTYLAPLAPWLEREDVTDILVNQPGEVWFETLGKGLARAEAPALNETTIMRLAGQIAAAGHQGVNREHPILAASLPTGERVQIVLPPAARRHAALAIRKQVTADLSLSDYARAGAFADTQVEAETGPDDAARELDALLKARALERFFQTAVRARKNILVSGGTSTGKTTFLNALMREAPASDRLVVIEDTAEVRLTQPNAVGLLAVKGSLGEARVGVADLLQAALRMRPDRILVGELRGEEAFAFLRAVNTGHPGSITTVHADTPSGALEQIALMVLQTHANIGREEVMSYARSVIDIIVQLSRRDGRRVVSQIVQLK